MAIQNNIQLDDNLVAQVNKEFSGIQPSPVSSQPGISLDDNLVAQVNKEFGGSTPVALQAYPDTLSGAINQSNDKNYQAQGAFEAAAMGVNNAFEQFGREIKDKFLAVAPGTDVARDNLKQLYNAAEQQQAANEENYPISATTGSIVGGIAKYAPLAAASGTSLLAQGLTGAAAGAVEDMNRNPLQAAALGGAAGVVGGVLGNVVGAGINKIGNSLAGVLTQKGEKYAATEAATGIKPTIIAYAPPWMQKTFGVTGDMPFSGSEKAMTSKYSQIQNNVDNLLAKHAAAMHDTPYARDMVSLVKASTDPNDIDNHAATRLLDSLANDSDWTTIVSKSGNLNKYHAQAVYDSAKNEILQQADHAGTINVKDMLNNFDGALKGTLDSTGKNTKLGFSDSVLGPLAQVRQAMVDNSHDGKISFSDSEDILKSLQSASSALYSPSSSATTMDKGLLQGIKKNIEQLQFNSLEQTRPDLWPAFRDLKNKSFDQVQKVKASGLVDVLGNANPTDAIKSVMGQVVHQTDAPKNLYNMLDARGKNAVKSGYLEELFNGIKGTGEPVDLASVKSFSSAPLMKKLAGNENFVNTFFTQNEKSQIVGAIKALDYMDGYKNLLTRNPTGRMTIDLAKIRDASLGIAGLAGAGAAAGGAALASGGAAAIPAGFAIGTVFNKLMNRQAGHWLAAASTLKPGSPAYLSAMEHITKMAVLDASGEAGSST